VTSRFDSPSSLLQPRALLRKGRAAWMLACGLALCLHGSLSQIGGGQAHRPTAQPLTTRFVKRAPRLTKPLELKKRPRPRRRMVQRQMVSVKAHLRRRQLSARALPAQLLRNLQSPSSLLLRPLDPQPSPSAPHTAAAAIRGARESDQKIDMSLEMLDMDALDTGKHHAMVVVDPLDRRDIRGFLYLAYAYTPSMRERERSEEESRVLQGLVRLADAVNRYTDIRAGFRGRVLYDSDELLKVPWCYAGSHVLFKLTASEASNLGEYLLSGGFVFAEDYWPGTNMMWTPGYTALWQMFIDALRSQGAIFQKDWVFERLPSSHPLYHCYFDFNGPPKGEDLFRQKPVTDYLEGITIRGRLVGILSKKGLMGGWCNWGPGTMRKFNFDPARVFQFGVNAIVFALTQEGSITNRVMDEVK